MAEIRAETITRVKTGVAGGAVLLGLIVFGGYYGVSLVAAILASVMCFELANVFFKLSDKVEKTKALVGSAWISLFINMLMPKSMAECLAIFFMGFFAYFLATAERHTENLQAHFQEFVVSVFALVYVVTLMAFFPMIRDGANGSHWVLLFLFIVWATDTGAYFAGHKYGKRKLYPLISPGKSVEGLWGGVGASVVVAILYKLIFFKTLGIFGAILTAAFVSLVSQVGDLCESFFKRAYGIKDSGKILPGHGGMLDRFDGVLFSLPIMYFCVKIFS